MSSLPTHRTAEVLALAHARQWTTATDYRGHVDPLFGLVCTVTLDGPRCPLVVKGSEVSRSTLAALLNQLAHVPIESMEFGG